MILVLQVKAAQTLAKHQPCGKADHWNIADLGYEWNCSRCTGVNLEDINFPVGNRVLNIDKTENLQLNGDLPCVLLNCFPLIFRNADRRQNAG